jgi:LemA protein
MRKTIKLLFAFVLLMAASGCGYNSLQARDEQVNAAWAEVQNQYQRRADLVPNLVKVVQGYAAHEKEVLTQVTEARARVGTITLPAEGVDEQTLARFQKAQREMGSALARLIAVAENYPQLKADALFRDLQAQLEGTENRIAVARNRFIAAVQEYNVTVRSFPSNLTAKMFGFKPRPTFTTTGDADLSKPPEVDFGKQPG